MTPRKCGGVFASDIDGELILLNGNTGNFHSLKGVGLAVWNAIDGVRTLDDIVSILSDCYAVDRATCFAEIAVFIDTLRNAGFLDSST